MDSNRDSKESTRNGAKYSAVGTAFLFSALLTVISIPVSTIISLPDLPGFVLVITGGIASTLSVNRDLSAAVWLLMGLIFLMAINTVVHLMFHAFHVSHNWFDPIYVGVVGIYCVLAFVFGIRALFLRRDI